MATPTMTTTGPRMTPPPAVDDDRPPPFVKFRISASDDTPPPPAPSQVNPEAWNDLWVHHLQPIVTKEKNLQRPVSTLVAMTVFGATALLLGWMIYSMFGPTNYHSLSSLHILLFATVVFMLIYIYCILMGNVQEKHLTQIRTICQQHPLLATAPVALECRLLSSTWGQMDNFELPDDDNVIASADTSVNRKMITANAYYIYVFPRGATEHYHRLEIAQERSPLVRPTSIGNMPVEYRIPLPIAVGNADDYQPFPKQANVDSVLGLSPSSSRIAQTLAQTETFQALLVHLQQNADDYQYVSRRQLVTSSAFWFILLFGSVLGHHLEESSWTKLALKMVVLAIVLVWLWDLFQDPARLLEVDKALFTCISDYQSMFRHSHNIHMEYCHETIFVHWWMGGDLRRFLYFYPLSAKGANTPTPSV